MSRTTTWTVGIIVAVICAALGVYYLIPNIYHPFTFSGTPSGSHPTHGIVFFLLAIVAIIGARFAANAQQR